MILSKFPLYCRQTLDSTFLLWSTWSSLISITFLESDWAHMLITIWPSWPQPIASQNIQSGIFLLLTQCLVLVSLFILLSMSPFLLLSSVVRINIPTIPLKIFSISISNQLRYWKFYWVKNSKSVFRVHKITTKTQWEG